MAQQQINLGTVPNDGTGDPLRTAMDKVNDNFAELYGGTLVVDVRKFGARGDGTGNDTPAIMTGLEALNAAGGGVLFFPAGTYLLGQHVSATYAIERIGMANVKFQGAGREQTILKIGNNVGRGVISWAEATNCAIVGMTLDGNSDNNTLTGRHGFRGRDINGLLLQNIGVINTMGYGIGLQDGDISNIRIDDFFIKNTNNDGIDMKNKANSNSNCIITNGVIQDIGRITEKPGIDIRGPATVSNIFIKLAHVNTIGIRARKTAPAEGTNGIGGRYTSIANIYVDCGTVADTNGIILDDPQVKLANATVLNSTGAGIWITADAGYCSVTNCVVDNTDQTTGTDFQISSGNNTLSNCHAWGGGAGFRFASNYNFMIGCHTKDTAGAGFKGAADDGKNMMIGCSHTSSSGVPYENEATGRNWLLNCPTLAAAQQLVANGNIQVEIGTNSNVVNWWHFNGGQAGQAPAVTMIGTDTNIPIQFTPKGVAPFIIGGACGVRFPTSAGAPAPTPSNGQVYYDTSTNKLRVYAGGAWVDLH
jgi:hypothetical protein